MVHHNCNPGGTLPSCNPPPVVVSASVHGPDAPLGPDWWPLTVPLALLWSVMGRGPKAHGLWLFWPVLVGKCISLVPCRPSYRGHQNPKSAKIAVFLMEPGAGDRCSSIIFCPSDLTMPGGPLDPWTRVHHSGPKIWTPSLPLSEYTSTLLHRVPGVMHRVQALDPISPSGPVHLNPCRLSSSVLVQHVLMQGRGGSGTRGTKCTTPGTGGTAQQ